MEIKKYFKFQIANFKLENLIRELRLPELRNDNRISNFRLQIVKTDKETTSLALKGGERTKEK